MVGMVMVSVCLNMSTDVEKNQGQILPFQCSWVSLGAEEHLIRPSVTFQQLQWKDKLFKAWKEWAGYNHMYYIIAEGQFNTCNLLLRHYTDSLNIEG